MIWKTSVLIWIQTDLTLMVVPKVLNLDEKTQYHDMQKQLERQLVLQVAFKFS